MIEDYGFGMISVDGYTYGKDLILLPDRVIENWWRKSSHRLSLEDVQGVLESHPCDVIVIGTGKFGLMHLTPDFKAYLAQKNLPYFAEPTDKAIQRYNDLVTDGKRVIGLFHLTC